MKRSLCSIVSLFISAIIAPTHARITHASIEDDNRRAIMLSQPFGFTSSGEPNLFLELTNPQLHFAPDKELRLSCFTFYLVHASVMVLQTEPENGEGCDVKAANPGNEVLKVIDFDQNPIPKWLDMSSEDQKNENRTFTHMYSPKTHMLGGLYSLYFVNCCNKEEQASVSFDIMIDMWNVIGGQKNHLSVGEIELPHMYMVMCFLFTAGLVAWSYQVITNREHAHRIHYLMIALGCFKVLTLLSQSGMYHYIRVTGEPDGWNVAYYIFTFFRSVFLFTVIILIGTGWSYMTPFLGDKERRILLVVLPLQVVMDIAVVVVDEFTPAQQAWFAWRDLFQIADIVCCCAILFPIAWRIRHLRDAAISDGKAERSMQQLVMFRHFYIMVVVYIYFTRIVVHLLEATLPAEYAWLSKASEELATLFFYTLTSVLFQPQGSSQTYIRLVTADEIEMGSF